MGIFTIFDALTGNPGEISSVGIVDNTFKKKYDWHNKGVRAILKDGTITDKGHYDSYGKVVVGDNNYKVINTWDHFDYTEEEHDGFMLLESIYQLLISNPKYSELAEDYNLYNNLKTFYNHIWLKPVDKFIHNQVVLVTSKAENENYSNSVCDTVNSWPFTDPDNRQFGRKNRKRILEIIDYFLSR